MRVMGLDLKPARSGIAMNYDSMTGEERLSVAAVDVALRPLHEQVRAIERAVLQRVRLQPVDHVFIEGTFSRQAGSDYGQHAAHFAATHILWSHGVPWTDVSPSTLKIWATGSGAARGENKVTKDQVIEWVIGTYGRLMSIPAVDDECDAVAAMTMCLAYHGLPLVEMNKQHTRALTSLEKTLNPVAKTKRRRR